MADDMAEIGPDHPDYERWLAEVKREEEHRRNRFVGFEGDVKITFPKRGEDDREDG